MKIVFFGSSTCVTPIIRILQDNFDLKLVVTTEESEGAVPSFCKKNKIEYITIKQFGNQIIEQLKTVNVPLGIVADFGIIIPSKILNLFPKGLINIHPSLLPKYRGPSPVQESILNNDKITGVSIMKIDEQMDHGPILAQKKEEILNDDTAKSLYERLFEIGANLLPETLNKYINSDLKPIAQNHKKATFTKILKREDGLIDISNPPPKDVISRMTNAYFPWPGAWFKTPLRPTFAKASAGRQGSEGQAKLKIIKLLPFERIQVEGKKPMSYKDFANGYPEGKEVILKLNCSSSFYC